MSSEGGELSALERHRPLVRETDKSFSRVYGFGGAAVLGAGALALIVAWVAGILWHLATFVIAVTLILVGLFVLRGVVNRKRDELRKGVESYCELNAVDLAELRRHAAAEGIYPYFEALFETPPSPDRGALEHRSSPERETDG